MSLPSSDALVGRPPDGHAFHLGASTPRVGTIRQMKPEHPRRRTSGRSRLQLWPRGVRHPSVHTPDAAFHPLRERELETDGNVPALVPAHPLSALFQRPAVTDSRVQSETGADTWWRDRQPIARGFAGGCSGGAGFPIELLAAKGWTSKAGIDVVESHPTCVEGPTGCGGFPIGVPAV